MTSERIEPDGASAAVIARQRLWGQGWRRWIFPGLWLVYLGQTISGVHKHSHGAAAAIGYAIVVAFAVCYLAALTRGWRRRAHHFAILFATAVALTIVGTFFAREDALTFCVYLAVLIVASRWRIAPLLVAAMAAAVVVLPDVVPGWGGSPDWTGGLAVVLVSLAMYGFFAIIRTNVALAEARSEVARLAAENERSRIARDLHDLLGHSLTTITVKAALARRLADIDPQRAAAEIAAVEDLARGSLTDVRAAVSGYRYVTLAGEVASAQEVLRAAGITADLPRAVDVVDPRLSELFGWVVREGVTNVVRHSRASRCTVLLGQDWIEISDNGRGGVAPAGSGLTGLEERVRAQGGVLSARPNSEGWQLRVEIGPSIRDAGIREAPIDGRVSTHAAPVARQPEEFSAPAAPESDCAPAVQESQSRSTPPSVSA